MLPWNNWFHCTGNTYGTWLRGDPRGFRTRHHREHVDGDYKNPPAPGTYDALYQQSAELMSQPAVVLRPSQRFIACGAFVEALLHREVEVRDLCVGSKHWHLLARFWPVNVRKTPHRDPRRLIGSAKTWSVKRLREASEPMQARVWGAGCGCKPIVDEGHFDRVCAYIPAHEREGAVVWSIERRMQDPGP